LTTICRTGGTVVPFSAIGNTLVKETQNDGRTSPRRRVLKAGIAASNDRHITVACTVRDVSATGARLRTESSLNIPDTFELIIDVDGLEANCEVVWRKGNEVGARFLGAPRQGLRPTRSSRVAFRSGAGRKFSWRGRRDASASN
jgi:hypothetical protein